MQDTDRLLGYLQEGVNHLVEQGKFSNGYEFRRTQGEALKAYQNYLNNNDLTTAQKLKGFFEIPTGIGKTAIFVALIAEAHKAAKRDGQQIKTAIVVPTIQLMEQTKESFVGNEEKGKAAFAPELADQIGFYGDGNTDLEKNITIMTYDAWYDLSQSGEIGSHNIDILISDEAHRGTSERRIENIKDAFNEQTVQLAFTATAHFDKQKSVQESHKREIFYKAPKDAIAQGELAPVVSHPVIIRIEPTELMLSEEFNQASTEKKTVYRRKIREDAWNDFAVKGYREGRNEVTGEPLSDNQAGFFVGSTRQADELEKMLNDDPVLQAKAEASGYKGVAVAIHTVGISPAEQKRRFKAYQNGEYMAVVGDEKFKEGFDHPPMKTIFDIPHGSLVDKAQIIGRGLRKWWNEDKERYEGLTFIDTILYIGSNDNEEDEKLRNEAKKNAHTVSEVLGSSYVLGPGQKLPERGDGDDSVNSPGGGPVRPFDDDPNIDYLIDPEDIYHLQEEIEELRQGFILTMADIIATIDAYREANDGENPTVNSGPVTVGPFAGKTTWRALNQSLQKGRNGLADDTEWQRFKESMGDQSLGVSSLLIMLGYKAGKLTMADIIATIDAYREVNDGENPTVNSGPVTVGPFAGKTTWKTFNSSLKHGYLNLSDDPEWQNLNKKLGDQTLSLAVLLGELGCKEKSLMLTIADIIATIDAYRAANDGKNPAQRSGPITVGPLAGKATWMAINHSLRQGGNGLIDDPEWQNLNKKLGDRTFSLAVFLKELSYKEQPLTLTMADIIATIDAYREKNGGETPTQNSGLITVGPLSNKMTWKAIDQSFRLGGNSLIDDPEWQRIKKKLGGHVTGIYALFIVLGYKEESLTLTMANIIVTINAYRKNNGGQSPKSRSGLITVGPLAGKMKWGSLDSYLRVGAKNLINDSMWIMLNEKHNGKSSLSKLNQELSSDDFVASLPAPEDDLAP